MRTLTPQVPRRFVKATYVGGMGEALFAATSSASRSSGITIIGEEDEVSSTMSGASITGTSRPPAKAEVADSENAAASASFFMFPSKKLYFCFVRKTKNSNKPKAVSRKIKTSVRKIFGG